MGWKSVAGRILANISFWQIKRWSSRPIAIQEVVFKHLLEEGAETVFGQDHNLGQVKTYEEYKLAVPIRDYEELVPYIKRATDGESNILWPGKPLYFCKTSGTTSGAKYIPITADSMPGHIASARNALMCYTNATGSAAYADGKMIQLQGSPKLNRLNGIPVGRLSGIVANHVPKYLQKNRMPSFEANSIEDWDEKINAIVEETHAEDMRLIAGIPIWIQGYFEKLLEKTGRDHIIDLFPNLELIVHGGVNFKPYQKRLNDLLGKSIPAIELYPASEGFIAYQDRPEKEGLLLVLNQGMFYEFIPADEYYNKRPTRIALKDVQLHVNYALILNTNAGLWGYSIGDTVKFVSLSPYRIIVTGRIKHFISAFGEHVIGEEVDKAMNKLIMSSDMIVNEFSVAPQLEPANGLPYHEWFVEFDQMPRNIDDCEAKLDEMMRDLNPYYRDLVDGRSLRPLKISVVNKGAFEEYMRSIGKYGGQNKVPRLSNDRKIADALLKIQK